MAIYVITGRPRHGKTYYLATLVFHMLKNGERVYSNIKFNVGEGILKRFSLNIVGDFRNSEDRNNPDKLLFYWRNLHEWEHFEKGNIIVDEMTTYFNPRLWVMLSEDTEIKLRQHGKEDLNVFGTTQHYTRIDIALRQLVEEFRHVETIWGNPDNDRPFLGLKFFRITGLQLEDIEDYYFMQKHPESDIVIPFWRKILRFKKKFALSYNTREQVGRSEAMPLVHKVRICDICGKEEIKHV